MIEKKKPFLLLVQEGGHDKGLGLAPFLQFASKNLLDNWKIQVWGLFPEGISIAPPLSLFSLCQLPHPSKIKPHLVHIDRTLQAVAAPVKALHTTHSLYLPGSRALNPE